MGLWVSVMLVSARSIPPREDLTATHCLLAGRWVLLVASTSCAPELR